nr:tRNA lysidine(34) synthetase TilS [Phenylobacterium sp.]
MRGLTPLESTVAAVLDARLLRDSPRPLAVALSGGGDSLALTLIADAWARAAGRPLIVLSMDHGLQPQSRAWLDACAATAARLGRPFRALAWAGEKPASGVPAAARAARHRLLAEAGRAMGARVILMGHTADDAAEAQAMRAAGGVTPDPREWAPSPAWPAGRGVFLLRPLMGVRRAGLRDWLTTRGETWIDDPANDDLRYARARARRAAPTPARPRAEPPLVLAAQATEAAGVIRLARAALVDADPAEARRFVAVAAVCAGGGARPPARGRAQRAAEMLRDAGPVVTTLAGARIEADAEQVRIFREPGEARRGGLAPVAADGEAIVWDGRFDVEAKGHETRRLAGLIGRLPADQRAALARLPPAARGALPAWIGEDGSVSCPALTGEAASLVGERLRAAAGLVVSEPA